MYQEDSMKSNVYFIDLRATHKENFVGKLERLVDTAGLSETVKKRDLVAVKLHFGEFGNTAFIRPVFIRRIVDSIKNIGGYPFLTDANTLYAGTRSDSPHHLATAIQNGFAYSVVGAPLIIADGLRGKSEAAVTINQKRYKRVYIATDIVEADAWDVRLEGESWHSIPPSPQKLSRKNVSGAGNVSVIAPNMPCL